MTTCRLSPVALGLSLGVIWGISVLIIGLIASYYAYGKPFVTAVGAVYIGYAPTVSGSIIGGIIAFVDSFISGFIIAWLYNCFSHCCKRQ